LRLRLLCLLLVATLSGGLVVVAGSASAGGGQPVLPPPPALQIDRAPNPCPVPRELRDEFQAAAADTALPLALLVAVATVESNLDTEARSPAGAHGLLQVLPSTAAELELDPYQVGENVLAGARYLRQLLDRFESADLALAAYNAGPAAVELEGLRANDETVAYVASVTRQWRKLLGCT
jgi:soluble lytic murein transglycosylase-like protein